MPAVYLAPSPLKSSILPSESPIFFMTGGKVRYLIHVTLIQGEIRFFAKGDTVSKRRPRPWSTSTPGLWKPRTNRVVFVSKNPTGSTPKSRRRNMAKEEPLYMRLHQQKHLTELVRVVGYVGFPQGHWLTTSATSSRNTASEGLPRPQRAYDLSRNRVMLNRVARPLCGAILGPRPEEWDTYYTPGMANPPRPRSRNPTRHPPGGLTP